MLELLLRHAMPCRLSALPRRHCRRYAITLPLMLPLRHAAADTRFTLTRFR